MNFFGIVEVFFVGRAVGLLSRDVDTGVVPSQRIFASAHHTRGFQRLDPADELVDQPHPQSKSFWLRHSSQQSLSLELHKERKVFGRLLQLLAGRGSRNSNDKCKHVEFINVNRVINPNYEQQIALNLFESNLENKTNSNGLMLATGPIRCAVSYVIGFRESNPLIGLVVIKVEKKQRLISWIR